MQRSPWRAVVLGAVTSVGTAAFGIVFVVRMRFGLAGVIGGQAVGSWLGMLAAAWALRSVWRMRAVDPRRLPPMLRVSAPLVLMTNLNWIMGGAVSYFVNFLCSRQDAGLYQVANSLASILGLVILAFDQAWAPLALSIRDVPTARRVYGVAVEAAFVLGLLLAYAATAFATPALLIITHPQYVEAQWVLALLALNMVLINIPSILSVTFAREKVTMPLAKATAAGALVTVVLVPLLAKGLGKEGAALAVLVGTITILVLTFLSSQSVFPIEVRLPRIGAATLVVALWGAAFLAVRPRLVSLGPMLGGSSALVLTLAAALAFLYRAPLKEAWLEGRAARGG
jgi:O-antigen/teichoic acid export membrane protein